MFHEKSDCAHVLLAGQGLLLKATKPGEIYISHDRTTTHFYTVTLKKKKKKKKYSNVLVYIVAFYVVLQICCHVINTTFQYSSSQLAVTAF